MKNTYTMYMADGSVFVTEGFSEIDAFMSLGYDECEFVMVDKCLPGNRLIDYFYDESHGKWIPIMWTSKQYQPKPVSNRNPHIIELLDVQSKAIWGRSLSESQTQQMCVACGSAVDDAPPTYYMDGFCTDCCEAFTAED